VLTSATPIQTTIIKAQAEIIPYFQSQLHEGSALHLGHWLQFNRARVAHMEEKGDKRPMMTLILERPIVHPPGARAVLNYPDGGRLRVAGTIPLA